ncbi:MAG: penicillin-binding transpeptidase domain-containing protein [Dermatophilaceae bacterium]
MPARRVLSAVAALGVSAALLSGCGLFKRTPAPNDTAQALASGLARGDVSTVPFDGATSAAAAASVTSAFGDLVQTPRTVTVSQVTTKAGDDHKATATLAWTWDVSSAATDWTYSTEAALALAQDDTWHVTWSPTLVEPKLTATEKLRADHTQAKRAEITGANGVVLMGPRDVYRVGIDKGKVSADQAATSAAALAGLLNIDPATYVKTVTAAGPQAFVVALTIRVDDPIAVSKHDAIAAVPGASQVPDTATLAPTAGFARAILGTVGPATAELVQKSGGTISAGDQVGLSGLQQRYDAVLAGMPGLKIRAAGTDAAGGTTSRQLFSQDPVPGRQLATTLDPDAQNAAETALAPTTVPTSLVAIRASTGEVLAAANGPATNGAALATTGRAAPGSTFKVVSSLALLRAGLTPDSPLQCDPSVVVDGRTFKNYDDYPADRLGRITLRTALANSCNTAFISQHDTVSQADLVGSAAALGIGVDWDMGLAAFVGSVPTQATSTEHAASMIGQGKVEASALAMATVAASVAKGATVVPHVVEIPPAVATATATPSGASSSESTAAGSTTAAGSAAAAAGTTASATATAAGTAGPSGTATGIPSSGTASASALPTQPPAPSTPLQPAEADALRSMMGSVVSEGSGRVLAGNGVTGAKTGTAEYGSDTPPRTHAWMIAFRGDLAVAAYVEDGQSGSKSAGPLLATFLTAFGG